ncbi:membrane-spanning 4-domains subfamily A member 4A-like isoform X2 [Anguilla anguilla]|uniref:membrane-spanning 4-domains subfamily A member 4A-like isoform X2 n=1 Tax=Anguilla anguilla TaxID=7936 RepID=UPI0015AF04BD|nr:membrane-spanning 4-domains subfamily A member 4A-like isoform X2 [Anguilla anguilla]
MVEFRLDIYCVVPGLILTVRSLLIKNFWAHLNEGTTCKMASSAASGFVVVTQVYPQQSGPTAPAFCTTSHVSSVLGKFLKGDPKALGTVQIMIGVLNILFGIVMAVHADSIGVYSGIVFWGALIYISSGALSVAANNKLNKCLVRGALGMNIISTITAGIAIILFSLDFVIMMRYYCSDNEESYSYYNCRRLQRTLETRSQGMTGVLLVFSILEFIISICVSAFACRAVCDCSTEQVVYIPATNSQVTSENLISTPNTYQMTISPILDQTAMGSMQTEMPPIYDELP